jgi:hypothetical protein
MTWNPIGPLLTPDPPSPTAERSRASMLQGEILQRIRTSRGPLIFAAIVQFLLAAVDGIVTIGIILLLIAVMSAEDIFGRTRPDDYAPGIAMAAAVALHIILGIGILRRYTWAMVISVCLSPFYLMVAYLFATPPSNDPLLSVLQLPAIIAFAIIVVADLLTLLQLKRAD